MKTWNFDNWTFISIELQSIVVSPTNCYKTLRYRSINRKTEILVNLGGRIIHLNPKPDVNPGKILEMRNIGHKRSWYQ